MKIFILKRYYNIILLSADRSAGPTFTDKVQYLFKTIATCGPVVFILDQFNLWFLNNELFFRGMLIAIGINMIFGYRWHKKLGDFKWRIFWEKNIGMWVIIICVYPLLEIMALISGDNIIGETFKISVQLTTILYPGSKALKNAHLLSEKRYPPGYIMSRLFTFEKSGNVNDLMGNENNNNQNNLE